MSREPKTLDAEDPSHLKQKTRKGGVTTLTPLRRPLRSEQQAFGVVTHPPESLSPLVELERMLSWVDGSQMFGQRNGHASDSGPRLPQPKENAVFAPQAPKSFLSL